MKKRVGVLLVVILLVMVIFSTVVSAPPPPPPPPPPAPDVDNPVDNPVQPGGQPAAPAPAPSSSTSGGASRTYGGWTSTNRGNTTTARPAIPVPPVQVQPVRTQPVQPVQPQPIYQPPVYQQPTPLPAPITDEKEGGISLEMILLIASAASNAILLGVLIWFLKSGRQPRSTGIPDSIKMYISVNLRNGYPIDKIRDALLGSGWTLEQVQQASMAIQRGPVK